MVNMQIFPNLCLKSYRIFYILLIKSIQCSTDLCKSSRYDYIPPINIKAVVINISLYTFLYSHKHTKWKTVIIF